MKYYLHNSFYKMYRDMKYRITLQLIYKQIVINVYLEAGSINIWIFEVVFNKLFVSKKLNLYIFNLCVLCI